MVPFIFILVVGAIIAIAIVGAIAARKRREALALLAARLGLNYSQAHDREIPRRYSFLNKLAQGDNRYAFNIISGSYKGHRVQVFDFHYETESRDSKGNAQTHHHFFSFFILTLPKSFPELTIAQEGVFSKIAQALGYDDIDFESHEFSRKFCVRSKNKKFAYDVCHTRMMDYLLANSDLTIEIEHDSMTLAFGRCLEADQIEYNLSRLIQIRELLPDYLLVEN